MTINREHLAGLQYARLVAEENWPQAAQLDILDDAIAQAQAAPEAEPVACLVRSRHMSTPARLAHDGKDHFTPWGEWEPGTLAYGESVTDAGRNTPCLYEMRPLYTAPQHDAELAELKAVLPELDDALESLEVHGRHSDQGYRELKDWYRKIAGITARIDAKLATLRHV